MAGPSVHKGDHLYEGSVTVVQGLTAPDGSITNAMIAANAAIAASKLVHRTNVIYQQADERELTHDRKFLYKAKGAGTISSMTFAMGKTIPAGTAGISFTIRKSTAGGAWAAVTTEVVIVIDGITGDVEGTVPVAYAHHTGVVSTAAYLADDLFEIVVQATYDGANTPGEGLVVSVVFDEVA